MTQSGRVCSIIQNIIKYNGKTVPRQTHAGKTFDLRKGFMEESGISILLKQGSCEGTLVYFIINGKSQKCFEKLTEMISGGI